jgi:hypothetical protein
MAADDASLWRSNRVDDAAKHFSSNFRAPHFVNRAKYQAMGHGGMKHGVNVFWQYRSTVIQPRVDTSGT